ncbi:MAG: HEPN domain-containing protein [Sphingobacteriia bacterium]|nr:HEPN domain-containing protein [Sphingobacteriia bacterium]
MTKSHLTFIKAWLIKAENDLASAERLIEIQPSILDTACFHCQQSVEKNLKAFLIAKGIEPKRTHDIKELLEACAKIEPVFVTINPKRMDDFSVDIRYPDQAEAPELKEALDLFGIALAVKQTVVDRISIDFKYDLVKSNPVAKQSKEKLLTKNVKDGNSLMPKSKSRESLLPKKRNGKSKGQGS